MALIKPKEFQKEAVAVQIQLLLVGEVLAEKGAAVKVTFFTLSTD